MGCGRLASEIMAEDLALEKREERIEVEEETGRGL